MRDFLVVVEREGDGIDDATFEMATLARRLAGDGGSVRAALLGSGVAGLAETLTAWFDEVLVADAPWLEPPDGVAWAAALEAMLAGAGPSLVLAAHTNVGMDVAPALALRAGTPAVADCLDLELEEEGLVAVRAMYGGKIHARVSVIATEAGALATVRPGAVGAGEAPGVGGTVRPVQVAEPEARRRRFLETVHPEPGAVDITQSERLVGVGRGIGEEEALERVRSLADALDADIAGTRPVVDKGWLPSGAQVGTSGVTVKPRLYLALGISGSFQHMGGIKGDPLLVAVNVDPGAPIFGVADIGVVADLLDFVPALERKVREAKG